MEKTISEVEDIGPFKQKVRHWMRCREELFYLDSCGVQNAYELGKYELLVGEGVSSEFMIAPDEDLNREDLVSFLKQNPWCFMAVAYDLKRQIVGLPGENTDALKWPVLQIVAPKNVIAVKRTGEVSVFSKHPEKLLEEIDSAIPPHVEPFVSYTREHASMTPQEHRTKVEYIKSEIAEGNLYEMNLCLEHVMDEFVTDDAQGIFEELIRTSPTPFSAFVRLGEKHLICASPERFIARQGERIYSQPIKGTSKRFENPELDASSRLHLVNSIKERAEHIMIVDLVRNDLSKVCKTGTVRVDELFGIYSFRQVNQMVSTISGQLEEETSLLDCLMAAFPMGSMTGAPKHITMQYIDQIETASRGWYSGSVGYKEPNGDFDLNVVIRSLFYDSIQNVAKYSVGGAITYDSDAASEYEECLLKSSAIRSVLEKRLKRVSYPH